MILFDTKNRPLDGAVFCVLLDGLSPPTTSGLRYSLALDAHREHRGEMTLIITLWTVAPPTDNRAGTGVRAETGVRDETV